MALRRSGRPSTIRLAARLCQVAKGQGFPLSRRAPPRVDASRPPRFVLVKRCRHYRGASTPPAKVTLQLERRAQAASLTPSFRWPSAS